MHIHSRSAKLRRRFQVIVSPVKPNISSNFVEPVKAEDPCHLLAGLEDVFVALKTGASDALEAVPLHLTTTLRCVPHFSVYSDFEEDISGHHIQNVLGDVDPDIQATHHDFEYYRRLQERGREAFSSGEVARWSSAQNTASGRDSPGWRLDKWKFLPTAEKALHARPDAKWYVIFEGDSYIIWRNLLDWLSNFDASRPYYLGRQMVIGDVVFAHGGAGIVMSRPALEKVVEHRRGNLRFYDEFTAGHWAGDCVLGKALLDAGIELFYSWPDLSVDQPRDMDFNDILGRQKLWCRHVASYHHMSPADISGFSRWEQKHTVGATVQQVAT
ncbi:hypothetical protein SCUP234_08121 [Seiridium cupressi]